MKIVIGVPSGDLIHADFACSLTYLVAYSMTQGLGNLAIINQKSSIIEKGRHQIIELALKAEADKVLFLDSDMIFPRDTLIRLLSHEKDIVGCSYTTRRAPIQPVTRDVNSKLMYNKSGLHEVGFIATGCLLVDMKVFKKLGKPYFRVEWCDDLGEHIGEDYTFSKDARKAGYTAYCDFDLSQGIYHIGSVPVSLADANEMGLKSE